jgi:class 3 adenylate cyclase
MEPRIQYVKTSDGVSIAYFESGQGAPILHLNDFPFSHVQVEDRYIPGWHEVVKRSNKFIRLDPRGMGMSDRDVDQLTLDGWVSDIETVVGRLGLDRFGFISVGTSGVVAIAYAARHPEKVSRLVLVSSVARPADAFATPQIQSLNRMLVSDWEMFSENVGALAFGWGREEASKYGEFIRASASQASAQRVYFALAQIDVTDLLPSIAAPTLVLHHSAIKYAPLEMARRLVSHIPDGRLVVMEGYFSLATRTLADPIMEFLSEEEDISYEIPEEASSVRVVLFTDLVGHTEMMSRLGDEAGRAVLREYERITREVLKQYGGTEVKSMGDGFMASFGSVTRAVECAVALQRTLADREGEPLNVRVGLNAGEPIEEDGDLFGATVILASRIAAKAAGGEILVADTVRGLCSGKRFLFVDRGDFVAKGVQEPVRISEVSWRS